MFSKNSFCKLGLVSFGASLLLVGCGSSTPNNVSLTVQQGQCVTGPFPGYEATVTATNLVAFPMNANLPAQSPYCTALTITNNNSGKNANNIQVANGGLSISYTVGSTTTPPGYLVDFNAAGVPKATYPIQPVAQQVGNIALFDPNNCVTTLGSNVKTLSKGGGSCTFYLQLVGESLPVGKYPLNLTIGYTNGNSNYSTSTTLTERSNLYLGGQGTPNVNLFNGVGSSGSVISAGYVGNSQVTAMVRDPFGNVYTGDILGNIYKYNGTSSSSWLQIASGTSSTIVAITSDIQGNIYFVDRNGYVAKVISGATTATQFGTTISSDVPSSLLVTYSSNQFSGLSVAVNNYGGSSLYNCTSSSCSFLSIGPDGSINQLMSMGGTILTASESNVFTYTGYGVNPWGIYASGGGLPGQPVTAMTQYLQYNSSGLVNTYLYAGVSESAGSTVSSVYSLLGGDNTFISESSGSSATISGTVNQLATDNFGGLFVAGQNLVSADLSSSVNAAYIPATVFGLTELWTPINGLTGPVYSMQTASQLTPY